MIPDLFPFLFQILKDHRSTVKPSSKKYLLRFLFLCQLSVFFLLTPIPWRSRLDPGGYFFFLTFAFLFGYQFYFLNLSWGRFYILSSFFWLISFTHQSTGYYFLASRFSANANLVFAKFWFIHLFTGFHCRAVVPSSFGARCLLYLRSTVYMLCTIVAWQCSLAGVYYIRW